MQQNDAHILSACPDPSRPYLERRRGINATGWALMNIAHSADVAGLPRIGHAVAAFAGWLEYSGWLCRWIGHDLRDFGYATPESGCIEIGCNRCGYSAGRKYLY